MTSSSFNHLRCFGPSPDSQSLRPTQLGSCSLPFRVVRQEFRCAGITRHDEENEERQRFIEEAQITGQLDHPNVVPIHELGVNERGELYFTMKLVEGQTMEAMLKGYENEVRRFDWVAPFLEILITVCDAIAFAHSRGVIHRDLKPGNIMVGSFGQVYVMDWGTARLIHGRNDVAVGRDRERQWLGARRPLP